MTNQIPLPGFVTCPTPAERVYVQFARRWRKEFGAVTPSQAPPRSVDEISLAALLMACEHGQTFTNAAWQEAEANSNLCDGRVMPWVDQLPWRLAPAQFHELPDDQPREQLICHLSHPNSSIRVWVMELAWVMRAFLRCDDARQRLLENVAGTMVGVRQAWGLAAELFDSQEEFLATAEGWQPEDFADQYARRLTILKDDGSLQAQASFWRMESGCCRQISSAALDLLGGF